MSQDILAAVAGYLQTAMGASLASSSGYAQVYSDYAPQTNPDGSPVSQPYCVVHDGPETYTASSGLQVGSVNVVTDGIVQAAFYATTKAQARSLGTAAVLALTDTRVTLADNEARVFALLPVRGESVSIMTEGVQQPTAFARIITVNYKQEFVE